MQSIASQMFAMIDRRGVRSGVGSRTCDAMGEEPAINRIANICDHPIAKHNINTAIAMVAISALRISARFQAKVICGEVVGACGKGA